MTKQPKPGLPEGYSPPTQWEWDRENGGQFANINRPIAGATKEADLPVGEHPLQLYSLATPNGVKIGIMLEELLAAGHSGAEYDAWLIKISQGDQFSSGFVAANPNSKIPALMDHSVPAEDGGPTRVFESASILHYLATKFEAFIPTDHKGRTECMNWLFWQMGAAPYLGGGFGHFYKYAPIHIEYAIDRFTMETKRQLDVLDRHLADNEYMAGSSFSIADMAIWPWYGGVTLGLVYDAVTFLDASSYKHLNRWTEQISQRPAVQRGRRVNRVSGPEEERMPERHSAADFDR